MQSGIVDFFIGKSRRRFSVHAALAGSFPKEILQPPLNGQVDEIVFGRCCEFVYSGDYSVPLPTADPCGDDGDQTNDRQALSRACARRWNPLNHRENIFHPTKLPDICAFFKKNLDEAPLDEDGEIPSTDPADNYAGVFLSHAEVYRLAFTTNWVSLLSLSLYRLIRSLASFTLCEERTGDIVELLKFVFEENEYMYELKVVLVDYAAWNVEILMRDADFRQLLSRVPFLEMAIFRAMWM
ncbi:uncharacterized protein AFUA_1G16080 [Aspergillus fumigatus Af293]|uniref:BTB domain-containing protein n=1 Tax=Aspergillus fumigatus (strain ATCC MYA-4609 / CBS 101355 / FGSC A1100 / Af293) TaxID=330879 RepID=Q4WRJ6_ASPFU|nr:hypothetical protein AFUA_1G16080 [Aspergillus fumigatus Af293]EAL90936.1 hypothetical protein AFUA_1G16080 [Aspergillus fumigatus Af293]